MVLSESHTFVHDWFPVAAQGESIEMGDVMGHSVAAGATHAPRLLLARMRALPSDVRLVPEPRGAFSNLVLAPLSTWVLKPHEVRFDQEHSCPGMLSHVGAHYTAHLWCLDCMSACKDQLKKQWSTL